jgi:osmotically-inducible protein OsmY
MFAVSRKSCVAVLLATAALLTTACGPARDAEAVAKTHAAAAGFASKGGKSAIGTDQSIEDSELAAKVGAAILADPQLGSQHIIVEADDAAVTLTGNVDSAALRERAVELAGSVEGVAQVQDRLEPRS